MLKILKYIQHKVSNIPRRKTNSRFTVLALEILASTDPTNNDLFVKINGLNIFERWLLLAELLTLKKMKAFHFLHVPKTGGTTFGETLGRDKKAVIISVDATAKTLQRQLYRFAHANINELVLSRAHHSLKLIEESGCIVHFKFILTAYRNPVDIHVSNINMIMRRLASYNNQEPMAEAEQTFCQNWLTLLGDDYNNSSEYAVSLANSAHYNQKMGSLYTRFFNVKSWKKLIRQQKLVVIAANSFDDMFTEVFNYDSPPERKNVSYAPLLQKTMLGSNTVYSLVDQDKEIAKFLSTHLTKPSTLHNALN